MLHVYHLESRFSTLIDEGPNEVITILFFCKELDHQNHHVTRRLASLAAWRVHHVIFAAGLLLLGNHRNHKSKQHKPQAYSYRADLVG